MFLFASEFAFAQEGSSKLTEVLSVLIPVGIILGFISIYFKEKKK